MNIDNIQLIMKHYTKIGIDLEINILTTKLKYWEDYVIPSGRDINVTPYRTALDRDIINIDRLLNEESPAYIQYLTPIRRVQTHIDLIKLAFGIEDMTLIYMMIKKLYNHIFIKLAINANPSDIPLNCQDYKDLEILTKMRGENISVHTCVPDKINQTKTDTENLHNNFYLAY